MRQSPLKVKISLEIAGKAAMIHAMITSIHHEHT
jgi:hypothetical protein